MSRYTRSVDRGAEVFAALMKSPRTMEELAEVVGVNLDNGGCRDTLREWVKALRASGVVHIKGYRPRESRGRRAAVFALQPAVFAQPDASREVTA